MEEGLIYKDKLSKKLQFTDYFNACIQKGYGCAIYRHPREKTIHMIIDLEGGHNIDKVEIENLKSGFIFHPFSRENHSIKYLNLDIHLVRNKEDSKIFTLNSEVSDEEINERFIVTDPNQKIKSNSSIEPVDYDIDKEKSSFINLVNQSIDDIQNNVYQKVVLSRTKSVKLPKGFNAVRLFDALDAKYNNAFIHLTHIPGIGTWAGATPEILIDINENNQFQTVALAATQAYNKEIGIEETTWSQKDIEEQAMVSRYIINCFKKIRLREFEEIGPRTYLSGNLVHLKTNFLVDLNQVDFPELGSVMLELLHPTSAVCGMPKEITQKFIEKHEGFDRSYFSGYIGPVNIQEETNIYVNLRCTKIENNHAQLFAGAGIISNSNPEKEWKETEIKMDTILSVIKDLQ